MRALRPPRRRSRAVWGPLAALISLTCAACSHGSTTPSQPASTTATPVKISSSLAYRTLLPLHVRWTATSTLPSDQVREVRFTIDRHLRWVDDASPYSYAGDGGYLVTTWLRPGPHDFITQFVAKDGTITTERSRAGVREPPLQPAAFGIWGRKVSPADAARAGGGDRPSVGRWVLYIDPYGGMWEAAPRGQAHAYQYSIHDGTFTVGVPIVLGPPGADGSYAGYTVGGYDCAPDGPTGTYRFRMKDRGGELTLSARHEPCGRRRAVLDGSWHRLD